MKKKMMMMYKYLSTRLLSRTIDGKRPVLTPAGSSGRARSPEGMRTVRDRCNSGSHGVGDDLSCGWGEGGEGGGSRFSVHRVGTNHPSSYGHTYDTSILYCVGGRRVWWNAHISWSMCPLLWMASHPSPSTRATMVEEPCSSVRYGCTRTVTP